MPAFGQGGAVGDQGIEIKISEIEKLFDPIPGMAADIQQMRERYVHPPDLEPITFNLAAANSTSKVDRSQTLTNSFTLSVITGTVDFFWGDYTTNTGSAAHMQFTATGAPVQIVMPPNGYVFTFRANGGAATFSFCPMYI